MNLHLSPYAKGLLITALGVLIISPDGLFTRLIGADAWTYAFWRGLLSGVAICGTLFAIHRGEAVSHLRTLGKPELLVALTLGLGSITFAYAFTHTTVATATHLRRDRSIPACFHVFRIYCFKLARLVQSKHVFWETWLISQMRQSSFKFVAGIIAFDQFNTTIVISGGTRNRTGRILVPIPELTNMCLPFSTICPIAPSRCRLPLLAVGSHRPPPHV